MEGIRWMGWQRSSGDGGESGIAEVVVLVLRGKEIRGVFWFGGLTEVDLGVGWFVTGLRIRIGPRVSEWVGCGVYVGFWFK